MPFMVLQPAFSEYGLASRKASARHHAKKLAVEPLRT